jgi:pyruvate dehydrogenase E1 component beta subunit
MTASLAEAMAGALAKATERDSSIVIVSERDFPVAERGNTGFALGLALGGKRPVLEVTSTGRLFSVLEVLAEAAAIASVGEFTAPLVVRVPFGQEAGPEIDRPILQLVTGMAGLSVGIASDGAAGAALLERALAASGPTVLLEPRAVAASRESYGSAELTGNSRLLRSGRDVTLAAWGAAVAAALEAAEALAKQGVEADVIDLFSLAPLDVRALGVRLRETGRLVVVGDDAFGARVLDAARMEAFEFLEAPPSLCTDEVAELIQRAQDSIAF